LDLPKNWDINKKYPLFMELHGSGNENTLATLSSQLSPSASALDLKGYTSTKSYMQQQGIGYHVAPFGRGNTRYIDIGEIDVFESYKDAHDNFKIDEDRRYLYGFSMGGGGTWTIGLRTPDLWAAMSVYAGGLWNEKADISLGKNVTNLPVYISCGDKDFLFGYLDQMKKELEKYNIKPEIRITKGLDHKYPDSIQAAGMKWMMQFTRKRPNQFSFSADKDAHTGVWGIYMNREEYMSGLPTFDCRIEGQTIKIDSKGTSGLRVNLGEKGLKMTGNVIVIWNGKTEYEGEVKEITLGKVLIDPWSALRNR
jgi:predicted esterase